MLISREALVEVLNAAYQGGFYGPLDMQDSVVQTIVDDLELKLGNQSEKQKKYVEDSDIIRMKDYEFNKTYSRWVSGGTRVSYNMEL